MNFYELLNNKIDKYVLISIFFKYRGEDTPKAQDTSYQGSEYMVRKKWNLGS